MPIPFIIAGVAVAATGYGAKKGYDAKCDYNDAEYYNKKAQSEYDDAQKELNKARKTTNINMGILGKQKLDIYDETLEDFVDVFSQIKNVDFEDNLNLDSSLKDVGFKNILEIKETVLQINELVGGTATALGSGALAGFGAFGGAGMLATASTGTAIGSLSGVAATNATLAWFGGGSLAAGGLGMAGGMMAAKAETAKNEALANLDKARGYVQEMNTAEVVVQGINNRLIEFIEILRPLNLYLENYIDKLESIVDKENDYAKFTTSEKETTMICVSIANTVKNICDVPIINEKGEITRKSKRALKKTEKFIKKLEEI